MSWLDFIIVGIIAISALIGAFRGLVKESVSLTSWILAIWIAIRFSSSLAEKMPDGLSNLIFSLGELQFKIENLKIGIAMLILFVLTLVVGAIVNFLMRYLVKVANLSTPDRMLGSVFGLARGAVLIIALVLAAGLTSAPQAAFWTESVLLPPFERSAGWVLALLPEHVATFFTYAR